MSEFSEIVDAQKLRLMGNLRQISTSLLDGSFLEMIFGP